MITWDTATICTAILMACTVAFVVLERYFPYTRGLPLFRKGFFVDFVWYALFQSFILKLLWFDWGLLWIKETLNIAPEGIISHWPVWALVLLFLVTHDCYIYWFHRWQHNNKWLWRTHEAHHSVEQVDWLAGVRSHSGEILINQTIEFLPIILLLDAETALVVVPIKALLDAVWGQFIHSNIDVDLGKVGYVINGPKLHQYHHADDVEIFHGNYATKFSLYDWIFGTAFVPNKKPKKFGVWYEYPRDYFMQHLFSVWRFNVNEMESKPLVKGYLNLRINLANYGLRTLRKLLPSKKEKLDDLKPGNLYQPKLEITEIPS